MLSAAPPKVLACVDDAAIVPLAADPVRIPSFTMFLVTRVLALTALEATA